MSHAGLYKFYVTNWDGDWTLAIQLYISSAGEYVNKLIHSIVLTCQVTIYDYNIAIFNGRLYVYATFAY